MCHVPRERRGVSVEWVPCIRRATAGPTGLRPARSTQAHSVRRPVLALWVHHSVAGSFAVLLLCPSGGRLGSMRHTCVPRRRVDAGRMGSSLEVKSGGHGYGATLACVVSYRTLQGGERNGRGDPEAVRPGADPPRDRRDQERQRVDGAQRRVRPPEEAGLPGQYQQFRAFLSTDFPFSRSKYHFGYHSGFPVSVADSNC